MVTLDQVRLHSLHEVGDLVELQLRAGQHQTRGRQQVHVLHQQPGEVLAQLRQILQRGRLIGAREEDGRLRFVLCAAWNGKDFHSSQVMCGWLQAVVLHLHPREAQAIPGQRLQLLRRQGRLAAGGPAPPRLPLQIVWLWRRVKVRHRHKCCQGVLHRHSCRSLFEGAVVFIAALVILHHLIEGLAAAPVPKRVQHRQRQLRSARSLRPCDQLAIRRSVEAHSQRQQHEGPPLPRGMQVAAHHILPLFVYVRQQFLCQLPQHLPQQQAVAGSQHKAHWLCLPQR
mmetsp:Transcript_128123/g.304174  ORF Transcript_128123/g.304174 Transcript_128123/m.304174 type:complete len:284 (+) Transcript_128123:563-1414(+)